MADRENFIITGNSTAANNQYTGFGGNPFSLNQSIQYGRVVSVNLKDRSITYEKIQNNLAVTPINGPVKLVGTAYNFNPNFTRLPEVDEIVPIIKGPNQTVGNSANQYNEISYYILGPISVQKTVNDNKVPQDPNTGQTDYNKNYKINDIGFVQSTVGQTPSTTPIPLPPTSAPSETPTPTPTPIPTPDPRGTFRENYTNTAGNEFELFSKKSGFNTTIYAYKKGTTTLLVTGSPSSTASIEDMLRIMKLTLQDNIYP